MSLTTATYNPSFKSGEFHHAVLSISGTTHTLYLDGSAVAVNSSAGDIFANNSSITTTIIGANNLFQNAFRGFIGDFRVYNYAISSTQVSNLYMNRNLVVHYPFDTSVNKVMPNYATLTYDASFVGNAALISPGFIGTSALSIANTGGTASQYVRSNPSFTLNSATGFTISCWINADTSGNANKIMRIFDIPYSSGIKGIAVDLSGTNMIYSSYAFNNFSSLVLYWPFNTNMNESINGYVPTTLYGTPTINNSVFKVGTGSLDCTGSFSYIKYTNSSGTILPISTTYTFSFWYYPTGNTMVNFSRIFTFIDSDSGYNYDIGLFYNASIDGPLYTMVGNPGYRGFELKSVMMGSVMTTFNEWNHIVISMASNGSKIDYTIWKNKIKYTFTDSNTFGIPQVNRRFAYINGCSTAPTNINDSSTTAYVDDFRVYTALLTEAEVTVLYNTR